MEDSTLKAWSSPGQLRLPLDQGMLEAARSMYEENRGALCTHVVSMGLLLEDSLELRANLICLFAQVDEIPISWLDHAFGINGREVWAIAQAEPICLFWCLDCKDQIHAKGPMPMRRLKGELEALRNSRVGEMVSTALLCGGCTEFRLHQHNEECRTARLAQQARTAQLYKMGAKYMEQPEWQQRRRQALARAGYRCQTCGRSGTTLDVHHNSYQNYGNESLQDLVVLCRSCHQKFHGVVKDVS